MDRLPNTLIAAIFTFMSVTYGTGVMDRRYRDLELDVVKDDWARQLAGFAHHQEAIVWALQNLPPDAPPNVLQFKAIANRAPAPNRARIEPPDPASDSPVKREALKKLRDLAAELRKPKPKDRLEWARHIVARARSGERLAVATHKIAAEALRKNGVVE
jgi:hypothetical protein